MLQAFAVLLTFQCLGEGVSYLFGLPSSADVSVDDAGGHHTEGNRRRGGYCGTVRRCSNHSISVGCRKGCVVICCDARLPLWLEC